MNSIINASSDASKNHPLQFTLFIALAVGIFYAENASGTPQSPENSGQPEGIAIQPLQPDAGGDQDLDRDQLRQATGLSAEDVTNGWISLFDGQTMFGWKPVSDANWQVVDGEIQVSQGDAGLLRTTSQFDDFILRFEFKATSDTNSGVFLRTPPNPRSPANDCYELNIVSPSKHDFPTGSLVSRAQTESEFVFDQWHAVEVTAMGPAINVFIDGTQTVSYTDENPPGRGYIGLQFNTGAVSFRNIVLKPLEVTPIFNGTTLDGWDTSKRESSEFSVTTEGELRIQNGRGQIESTGQFGDFIFSMQCRTGSPGLNSGVFFRSIPGEMMNGYESQIQNQFTDDDPTKPVDCGTGGIFRRSDARYVVAEDETWFSKTIIATGPHVSVWVNGIQVTDWSDTRAADPNPRRGLRLERGSIIFQGHDPTTDILMKNIRAREIKPRNR